MDDGEDSEGDEDDEEGDSDDEEGAQLIANVASRCVMLLLHDTDCPAHPIA